MSNNRVIAVVPMRHHSQRVPEKNFRSLGDIPLCCHIIDTLMVCPEVDLIVVETDSPNIKNGVATTYIDDDGDLVKKIVILDRPQDLTGVDVSMNDILVSTIRQLVSNGVVNLQEEDPIIFQTHATNPFLKASTIEGAVAKFVEVEKEDTTMMSVTKYQKRLWSTDGAPINHKVGELRQTQDLDMIYEENSNFYLFRVSTLMKNHNRIGVNKLFYPMSDKLESWDIDTEDDFEVAELIHSKLNMDRVIGDSTGYLDDDCEDTCVDDCCEDRIGCEKRVASGGQDGRQDQDEVEDGNNLHVIKPGVDQNLLNSLQTSLGDDILNYHANRVPGTKNNTVLISAPYMMPDINTFIAFYNTMGIDAIKADVQERLSAEDLAKYHGQYQVSVCGDDAFTPQVINESGVRAICKWGTGIDSIDSEYCKGRGIPVLNTPNAFSVPVSQSIISAIFGFARTTFLSNREMKHSDRWVKYQGYTLDELTIGIVGLGNIGRHVAQGLSEFRPNMIGYDINPDLPAIPWVTNVTNLESLLRQSDIVCVCTTLNPTSYHLINQQTIHYMKRGSYLINMARGPLVQESALVEAIVQGRLAGAALDVFEVEPLPEFSLLRSLPNVIISSHNTNSSPRAWLKVHINTIRNSLKAIEIIREQDK